MPAPLFLVGGTPGMVPQYGAAPQNPYLRAVTLPEVRFGYNRRVRDTLPRHAGYEQDTASTPPAPVRTGYDPNEKVKNALWMEMKRGTMDYLADLGTGIGQAFDNPVVQALSYAGAMRRRRIEGDPASAQQQFENELKLREADRADAQATAEAGKWLVGEKYDDQGRVQKGLYKAVDPVGTWQNWGGPKAEREAGTPVKIVRNGQVVWASPSDAYGQPAYVEPKDPRQPTDFDRKFGYYKTRGLDDQTAYGLAVGAIQPVTDPVTGQTTMFDRAGNTAQGAPSAPQSAPQGAPLVPWRDGQAPKQTVVKRADENDALDQTITRLDNMLSGETFQDHVASSPLGRGYNRVIRPIIGGEGYPESDQVKFEAEALKQTMVGLLQAGDKRIANEDFKRLESLIPTGSMFEDTRAARQKMAEARKLLVEIRNRPLPGDPRMGTQRPAGGGDPMNMGSGASAPSADPLGLFQ